MNSVRLLLAGGPGRLVRRNSVVLFDPTGQLDDLAERFVAAQSDSAALAELKRFLIESNFEVSPVAAAEWEHDELNLLVFGDLEVHTSVVAAPMVTGAGSSSWIERRLGAIELGDSDKVEVWSGADTDPVTDLERGTVACGGFRLVLQVSGPPESGSPESVSPAVLEAEPTAPVLPEPSAPAVHEPEPALSGFASFASGAAVGEPVTAPQPGLVTQQSVVEQDPFADAHAAPTPPPPAPEPPAPPASPAAGLALDDAVTQAGPPPQDIADLVPSRAAPGFIEASHCPQGHPNPPRASICYVCGAPLPSDEAPDLIEQPAVGRIVFVGGQEMAVDRAVLMGRKPNVGETGSHPVAIEHDEVSRSHALVTVEGWTVLLTDQGSRNGTWVSPPSDPAPVRLEERVPHVLEHGTTVHLGSPEVAFTYYFDSQ